MRCKRLQISHVKFLLNCLVVLIRRNFTEITDENQLSATKGVIILLFRFGAVSMRNFIKVKNLGNFNRPSLIYKRFDIEALLRLCCVFFC